MPVSRLILFDIDSTLITSGGAGERALARAATAQVGKTEDLLGVEIAGRTDRSIAHRIFEKHAIAVSDQGMKQFCDVYLQNLEQELPRHDGRVLPGVPELVEKLHTHSEVALGLLTGNLSRGAELKLTHFGLWTYFSFGAFADDHHDRNQLGRFATERACALHGLDSFPTVWVIGDTPHDIDCGRVFGAKTMGVATGSFTIEQLSAHGADAVVPDFSDVEQALALLLA